ncbi:MAG: NADH-quinone oxidoreductase subunit A [Acidimicrobiales bacterium]
MDNYLPILVLVILGFLFAALSFVGSAMLAPKKRPTAAKVGPYECGIVPTIEPPTRFPVRFYLVAMIFVIFDIEIVFLYPFAVVFRQLRSFGLVEVLVFAAVVFVSFLFLVSNGALTWGPAKHLVRAMPSRTSESTIFRIAAGPGGPDGHRDPTGPGSGGLGGTSPTDPVPPVTGDPAVPAGPVRAA